MIRLDDLSYSVGNFTMRISMEISAGEYFVIMGPTGSGKTAAVECLAGLRQPNSGRVVISGRDVTGSEPRHRSIGYVPQDYALFTHRTVRRNIGFGPEVRGWSREETERAIREAARRVGIENLLDRRIYGLSGGERQRVAVARALAVRPEVLILDEPVSALDEATRETLCSELRRVQREVQLTTIHISHNLEEAFSVADRSAVLRGGRLEQVGRMDELLRRPANEFVARFMRCENIFAGQARGAGDIQGTTRVRVEATEFTVPGRLTGEVKFVVRPENLAVRRSGQEPVVPGMTVLSAQLRRGVDRGGYMRLDLDAFQPLVAHMPAEAFGQLVSREVKSISVGIVQESIHVI